MHIRPGEEKDLDAIVQVIDTARAFMRAHGNAAQWVNGYPSRELFAADMRGGHCFVAEENGRVHAVFSLFEGPDPTYAVIEDGAWLNDDAYVCIHRIGSDGELRGVLQEAVRFAALRGMDLRADTHADNIPMQNALKKCGFIRCGVIYVDDGTPREAFQRLKENNV